MKKIKLLMCLLATAFLLTPAIAAKADADNIVTFDGKDMISQLNNASFDGMVPGDEVTVSITLKNTASFAADWYMKNDIFSALAAGRESTGGAFEYDVVYDGKNIFSSQNMVDNDTANGIADNVASLNDFVFLDKLDSGATKEVSLRVAVEGETQGNAYQNSLSNLRMSFAATSDEGETITTTVTNKENKETTQDTVTTSDSTATKKTATGKTPKTGDAFNMQLYSLIFAISGILVLALAIYSLYKDHKKEA